MKMPSPRRAPGPFTAPRRGRGPRRPCKSGTVAAILSRPRRPRFDFHLRRGSTVRVRQRALQKPRKAGLSHSGALAWSTTCGRYGAPYGAFRSRSVCVRSQKRPHWARRGSFCRDVLRGLPLCHPGGRRSSPRRAPSTRALIGETLGAAPCVSHPSERPSAP